MSLLGIYGLFGFFATVVTCTGIYAFFFMPETKGLSLIDIQRMYEAGSKKNKKAKLEDDMIVSPVLKINDEKTESNSEGDIDFVQEEIMPENTKTEDKIKNDRLEAIRITHPEEWTGGRKRTLSTA